MPSPIPNPKNKSKLLYRNSAGRFSQLTAPPSNPPSNGNAQRKKFGLATKFRLPAILLPLLLLLLLLVYVFKDLPSPRRLTRNPFPVSTKIYDRNGILLYDIFADQNRTPVKLSDLPPYVKQATISIEDKDFYKHNGFALSGIARASIKNLGYGLCKTLIQNCKLTLQGGSTITQQLVKTALLTPERTIRRKLRELVLTFAVESIYTKDQILEMYLNQVPYGGTSYGIESASQTYFGKKSSQLSLPESSLLAGLPAAPTRFSPFGAHPELAKERQQLVLSRMVDNHLITREQARTAIEEKLDFAPPQVGIRSPHFVLFVKDLLVQKYGEQVVETGGLRVTTSLDIDLQDQAQLIVASETAKLKKSKVGNGAALVTIPATGEILAMVGSKDYFDKEADGAVNITLRSRQPGSSIKPLNYALGIEKNLITPASLLADIPTCFLVSGQKPYCPDNYDNTFHGPSQARFALGNSYNIPAVKVLTLNNLENFVAKARDFGITTFIDPKNYGLSLTLGGGEVKMVDMAVAFGVFANSGIKVDLHPILKIEDYTGKILERYDPVPLVATEKSKNQTSKIKLQAPTSNLSSQSSNEPRIISPETAFLISHILLDNNARSATFGPSSYLNVSGHPEVSVKTGTTNDKRDNWTIGYNPERLIAVWVGNNDNSPLGNVASGVTGASPIWNRITLAALKNHQPVWPTQPAGIEGATICNTSGLLPPDPANPASCDRGQFRFEYFKKGTLPTEIENLRRDIPVDKTTGIQANDKTPPENIEMQNHAVVFDKFGLLLCLDCSSYPTEPVSIRPADFITPTPTPSP